MKNQQAFNEWLKNLTNEQKNKVINELFSEALNAEIVAMGDISPYWDSTGEPLVDGQKCWRDDD